MTRQEQETVINFNEAESEAVVYTHNGALIRVKFKDSDKYPSNIVFISLSARSVSIKLSLDLYMIPLPLLYYSQYFLKRLYKCIRFPQQRRVRRFRLRIIYRYRLHSRLLRRSNSQKIILKYDATIRSNAHLLGAPPVYVRITLVLSDFVYRRVSVK